jgi:predicted signal transduction protein with EAL and GGDEF domain
MVARMLRLSRLDPTCLELELTESLVLQDPDGISSTLHDLKDMGVECSIDDFGTGYSGLSYLTKFPIGRLKIDKSFVREISRGGDDARIVAAVIALAHGLRLDVTAEGVEEEEQLTFLRRYDCDEMQGFLFSRPLPADQFEQLLMLEEVVPGPGRLPIGRVASAGSADDRVSGPDPDALPLRNQRPHLALVGDATAAPGSSRAPAVGLLAGKDGLPQGSGERVSS